MGHKINYEGKNGVLFCHNENKTKSDKKELVQTRALQWVYSKIFDSEKAVGGGGGERGLNTQKSWKYISKHKQTDSK